MVAWCEDCQRYVNQYCDTCGRNFGATTCEVYACGGTMMCPICGAKNLRAKREFGPDPYDFSRKTKEERMVARREIAGAVVEERVTKCLMCGFNVDPNWKYCPECGVRFKKV